MCSPIGLHYGSSVFEGERAMAARSTNPQNIRSVSRKSAEILDFEFPYSVAEIDAAKAEILKKNGLTDAICPPGCLARQRDDGGFGHAEQGAYAIAVWDWPRCSILRTKMKGYPPRHCRISPA